MKRDVEEELAADPAIHGSLWRVRVVNAVVELSGHPTSYASKLAAERAVQRVSGVRALVSELDVRLPDGERRDDLELAQAVRSILHWTVGTHGDAIHAQVEHGWVTLTGRVDWAYQSHVALRAISQMRGVLGVSDRIEILGDVGADEIGTNIRRALERHAQREARHIEVSVKDGMVTLSGKVGSHAERRAARGAAWSARGVRAVVDELTVR
nr:BON domain-containing protein [Burkholderia glumae]